MADRIDWARMAPPDAEAQAWMNAPMGPLEPDVSAALAAEAAEEWRAEEEQTEAEDKARAERGERDQDRRA